MPLGFGRSSFRFASPVGSGIERVDQLAGKRIATAYPVLLQRHLEESGIKADVVKLDGAVETACRLGVADAVCDVVETGTTLRAAGLHIIGEPVLASEAILVGREGAEEIPAVAQLRRRLQGVLVARQYVMLDYDCPDEILAQATAITPGHRGPHGQPAAAGRLVGGAGDGAAQPDQPGDGRPLRARRPRHPGHQHPRLAASERRTCADSSSGAMPAAVVLVLGRVAEPAAPTGRARTLAAPCLAATLPSETPAATRPPGGISQADNDLQIEVDLGDGSAPLTWTLTCVGFVEGSHPAGAGGLRPPGRHGAPFAPLPEDVVCSQQYGGPETARVLGRWGGEPVELDLSRVDGCRIAQWDSLVPVVPAPAS